MDARAPDKLKPPPTGRTVYAAWALLLPLVLSGCSLLPVQQQDNPRSRFAFALFGDAPYNQHDRNVSVPNMIADFNRERLAFVVHDGDIKSGSSPCTDEIYRDRYDLFQTIRHPFVLVFGDNEWTDCGKATKVEGAGDIYDPDERLNRLREIFTRGNRSMGQRTIPLARQSESDRFPAFRENVRWHYGPALFIGLNIVGSRNNHGQPEFDERNRANLAWLEEGFAVAREGHCRAVMVIIQGNPQFEKGLKDRARAGYNDFLALLREETVAFGKPVVLVHGDSHAFQINKPMKGPSGRRVENFLRVETFGNPDMHWIRVRVDWRDPNVFRFEPVVVEGNRVQH